MIDRYLEFPIPEEECLSNFSSIISIDDKNRIRLNTEVKKLFTQDIFDILVFHDKEVPYIQIVPHDFYTKSYKSFLQNWQKRIFDDADVLAWLASFEEYSARSNTVFLDAEDRLTLPSLVVQKFSLQSTKKIHMVMSYPYIKLYKKEDYNYLLEQYAHSNK